MIVELPSEKLLLSSLIDCVSERKKKCFFSLPSRRELLLLSSDNYFAEQVARRLNLPVFLFPAFVLYLKTKFRFQVESFNT